MPKYAHIDGQTVAQGLPQEKMYSLKYNTNGKLGDIPVNANVFLPFDFSAGEQTNGATTAESGSASLDITQLNLTGDQVKKFVVGSKISVDLTTNTPQNDAKVTVFTTKYTGSITSATAQNLYVMVDEGDYAVATVAGGEFKPATGKEDMIEEVKQGG